MFGASLVFLETIGDSPPRQIIRGKFYTYPIPQQDPDPVSAHFPRKVGQDHMSIFQLNAKLGRGQGFNYQPLRFNFLFLLFLHWKS